MKLFTRFFCAFLCGMIVSAEPARADDKPGSTNSGAGSNAQVSPLLKMDDLMPDVAIARGKGFELKRSEYDRALIDKRTRAAAMKLPAQPGQLEAEALNYLILMKILNGKATDADKAKGKEQGDKGFDYVKKRAPSEEMLTRQLKSVGLTADMLHEGLIQEATAREVLHSKVTITDEQAKKYYEENPAAFDLPEMARISHILFLTTDPKTGTPITDDEKAAKKKRAEEALKRAKAGENFAALEKEYTEDTSRVDDKDGIKLYRGAKGIPAEFETAAFALQTNQISDIVASPLGFHIIKLAEKTPAGKEGFAEAEPNIKQFLQAQEIEKMLPKYTVELKKEENVEILDEKLKALDAIVTEATLKQLDSGAPKTNVPVK